MSVPNILQYFLFEKFSTSEKFVLIIVFILRKLPKSQLATLWLLGSHFTDTQLA